MSSIESSILDQKNNKVDYAILSAMPEELDFFNDKFSNLNFTNIKINEFDFKIYDYENVKVLVTSSGIGIAFAASVFTLIHSYFKPDYFLISGTAGGIKQGLKVRDVIVAETAFEAEFINIFNEVNNTPFENCLKHPINNKWFPSTYNAHPELLDIFNSLNLKDINFHLGSIVTSDSFPAPKELFEKIKQLNPDAIDMETSSFYQIAWLLNAKVLAVRGISNILNSEGCDENIHLSDVEGSSLTAASVIFSVLNKSILLKRTINSVLSDR